MTDVDARRRFVLGALASLAPIACVAPRSLAAPTTPVRGLAGAITTGDVPPAVDTLGRYVLKAKPEWLDRDALLEALALVEPPADEAAWRRGIERAIASEVEAGDFVRLAGWQLTPTECRIYALAALPD